MAQSWAGNEQCQKYKTMETRGAFSEVPKSCSSQSLIGFQLDLGAEVTSLLLKMLPIVSRMSRNDAGGILNGGSLTFRLVARDGHQIRYLL